MADWPTVSLTTALVLITGYYAWQNKRMVEEMRRQNGPYLYVFHDRDWLVIKNGGTRSAHQVKITLLKDADVPKQYQEFAQVIITRPGELPPPEPSEKLTPEKWAEITQGTVKVSTLPAIKSGVSCIAPGERALLARVSRHIGTTTLHQFECVLRYRDGVGAQYEEKQVVEYEI